MSELIQDKQSGFLVNSIDQAVEAINAISSINREQCREWAMSNFSLEKVTDGYYNVYKEILKTRNK
jgi:glycosyltransferase involved in cell wall biosynthesis